MIRTAFFPHFLLRQRLILSWYDCVATISAIGGTFGLCIGFSFFDVCDFMLGYLEQGVGKMKVGRREVAKTANRKVESPVETINEKLEWKMSILEHEIKTLQIKVTQLETR